MVYHSGSQVVDPYLLFQKVQLRPGMHVADLGCGRTGHVVFPAAPILGDRGIMYAVDIMKDVLEAVKKRAAMTNLLQVHTIWADVERVGHTAIPEKSLDVVFLVNTLVHTPDIPAVLSESARLLKEKGRILVVDWSNSTLPLSPPKDRLIDFATVAQWSAEHGFVVQEEFDVGQYNHGMVLYRHI